MKETIADPDLLNVNNDPNGILVPYTIDDSDEIDEMDDEESIPYLDEHGNEIPECVPRSVEELDVGIEPVKFDELSKISNLNFAKMYSKVMDEVKPYEKTGADKTGVIGEASFIDELTKANNEVNGVSDIILKECEPYISGGTNNE